MFNSQMSNSELDLLVKLLADISDDTLDDISDNNTLDNTWIQNI